MITTIISGQQGLSNAGNLLHMNIWMRWDSGAASGLRSQLEREHSSAVAHLWYLHGELDEFSRLLAGAAAVKVQLLLGAAAILLLLLSLRGQPDVSVRGEAAAHGPLQCSREQDHEVVETAVQAGEEKQRAVVWRWPEDKERRRMSRWFFRFERLRPARTSRIIGGKTTAAAVLQLIRTQGEDGAPPVMATAGIICVHFLWVWLKDGAQPAEAAGWLAACYLLRWTNQARLWTTALKRKHKQNSRVLMGENGGLY